MVALQVEQVGADFRRDALRAEIIKLVKGCRSRIRHIHFVIVADVIRRPRVRHAALYSGAIPIIREGCRHARFGDARQAIFDIIRERIAVARGHVAIGVVLVFQNVVEMRDRVLRGRVVVLIRYRHAVLDALRDVSNRIILPRATVLIRARRDAGAHQPIEVVVSVIRRLAARIVLHGQNISDIVKGVMQVEECVAAFRGDDIGQTQVV